MAAVIKNISRQTEDEKTMSATIYADASTDLTSEMEFFDGYKLEPGSVAYTKAGEVAILDSNGDWNWIGEE